MSVWLCQIAKNLWFNQYKKSKRFKNIEEIELLNIEDIDTIENIIISKDEKMSLYKKIQDLDVQSL